MTLLSTQDLFYLVAAVCLALIAMFLCWALFQMGRLIHQLNDMVDGTRQKIEAIAKLVPMVSSFLRKKKKGDE